MTAPYGHRPDWSPAWWEPDDLHHSLGASIARISRHAFTQPGLLATALEHEAAYLHASVSVHRRARPDDDPPAPVDFTVEDEHHAWLDADGWARREEWRYRVRLVQLLDLNRLALRAAHPDGRPYTEAA